MFWKYITTDEEALDTVEIINSYLEIAVDTETNGLDPFTSRLLLVQIGINGINYIYDARTVNVGLVLHKLRRDATYIFHNAKFDIKFLKLNYGWNPAIVFDTMVAESLITAGIGKVMSSLNDCTFKYLKVQLVKEIRQSFAEEIVFFTDQQLNYAADDVEYLLKIKPYQAARLAELELEEIAYNIEFPLVNIVVDMEIGGVGFDSKLWMEIYAITKERQKQAEVNLRELLSSAGVIKVKRKQKGVEVIDEIEASEINLNSHQQLIPTLAAFGIKVESTNFDTLSNIHHPVVEHLIKYKKLTKRLAAFGQSYIDSYVRDGIIRAGANQIGAATGRMSYEDPNLQQVPNPAKDPSEDINYRLAFIAGKGKVLIKADYSQIELRIATELSQEPEFINAYREGKDLHTLTASKVFHIPYEQIGKGSRERAIAKNINFAILYGSGWSNLVNKFQISKQEAKRILEEFHKAYPRLSAKIKELGNDSVVNGYSSTILGRRRFFSIPSYGNLDFDQILAAIRREGGNHAVQGTSADMTKLAIIYLHEELKKFGGRVVFVVHDEIVSEVPEEFADEAAKLVKECMIRAGKVMIKSIDVDVDVHIGKSWGG